MSYFLSQRGGVFGLDARVALIIFSTLTLVAGYAGLKAFGQVKAQGLITDMRAIGKGMAQMESDLEMNAYDAVSSCAGPMIGFCKQLKMYKALYDSSVLNSTYLSHWHGPYITPQPEPGKYGETMISPGDTIFNSCVNGVACYNWLSLGQVNMSASVAESINDALDGVGESSPDTTGSFMWSDNGGSLTVYYRLGRTISPM